MKNLVGILIGITVIFRSIMNAWGELLDLHIYISQSLGVSSFFECTFYVIFVNFPK